MTPGLICCSKDTPSSRFGTRSQRKTPDFSKFLDETGIGVGPRIEVVDSVSDQSDKRVGDEGEQDRVQVGRGTGTGGKRDRVGVRLRTGVGTGERYGVSEWESDRDGRPG